MKAKWIILLVVAAIVSGCTGPQAIVDATARDRIFSVEVRANGATVMWLVHDDVGTYCTTNKQLSELGQEIMTSGKDAIVHYRTLKVNDPEQGAIGGLFLGACNTERSDRNTNYLITGLEVAPDK